MGVCQQPARCRAIFWEAAEKGDRYGGTTMSKELSAQGLHPEGIQGVRESDMHFRKTRWWPRGGCAYHPAGPVASRTHLDLKEQAGQGAEPAARGPTWFSGRWQHLAHGTGSLAAILYHSVIFKSCSEKGSPAFPREASGGRQGSPPQRERWRAGKSLLTSGGHLFPPGVL